MRDRPEVPVGGPCDLGGVAARGDRGEGSPSGVDQPRLAESDAELAERREADVEERAVCLGDQALQVGALEHAADEDVERGERVSLSCGANVLKERLLECRGCAEDEPRRPLRGGH